MLLAGCGGGGTTAGGTVTPVVTPTVAPPTTQTQGNVPLSEAVAGGNAWVDPASHHTLYYLDVDTATGGTCIGGCLAVWPVFAASATATATGSMTVVARSDGRGNQWAYQGHMLYFYAGDNAADQANGDNIPDFGGHWHVARPSASTAPPTSGGSGCVGTYC